MERAAPRSSRSVPLCSALLSDQLTRHRWTRTQGPSSAPRGSAGGGEEERKRPRGLSCGRVGLFSPNIVCKICQRPSCSFRTSRRIPSASRARCARLRVATLVGRRWCRCPLFIFRCTRSPRLREMRQSLRAPRCICKRGQPNSVFLMARLRRAQDEASLPRSRRQRLPWQG